jgi:excisionase family DNA binding protein
MSTELLSTTEAAERLGLTVRAIQKMIEGGRLPARKVGRDYVIDPSALENVPKQAAGRPPKAKAESAGGRKTGKITPTPAPPGMTTAKEKILKWDKKGSKK